MDFQPGAGLQADAIAKRLGGRPVLREVSLRCAPSQTLLITGPNGVGKSTLLRILCGLLEPDRGQVRLGGLLLSGGGVAARRHLGYVPDSTEALPDLLASELCALVAALKGVAPPPPDWPVIDRLQLRPAYRQRLSTLSLGQRKRATLAAALVGDPWLLVLDEPSNGLDPDGVALLLALLGERRGRGQGSVLSCNDAAVIAALQADGALRLHLRGS